MSKTIELIYDFVSPNAYLVLVTAARNRGKNKCSNQDNACLPWRHAQIDR
jgi:2-hydroxychromene-2-carboxylate isomerase